jgi:hypothetical protein
MASSAEKKSRWLDLDDSSLTRDWFKRPWMVHEVSELRACVSAMAINKALVRSKNGFERPPTAVPQDIRNLSTIWALDMCKEVQEV